MAEVTRRELQLEIEDLELQVDCGIEDRDRAETRVKTLEKLLDEALEALAERCGTDDANGDELVARIAKELAIDKPVPKTGAAMIDSKEVTERNGTGT